MRMRSTTFRYQIWASTSSVYLLFFEVESVASPPSWNQRAFFLNTARHAFGIGGNTGSFFASAREAKLNRAFSSPTALPGLGTISTPPSSTSGMEPSNSWKSPESPSSSPATKTTGTNPCETSGSSTCFRMLQSVRRNVRAWPVKYTATGGLRPSPDAVPDPPPVIPARFSTRARAGDSGSKAPSRAADRPPRPATTSNTPNTPNSAHTRRTVLFGLCDEPFRTCDTLETRIASPAPRDSPRGGTWDATIGTFGCQLWES
mmetsp:Transcript_5192/g.17345  ORF Transcript_5192/g.17345 Transcript_5192/m.17345 type:complete len:260 (-) Transcript_5192:16-795(-)